MPPHIASNSAISVMLAPPVERSCDEIGDPTLLERIAAGEARAFQQFVELHQDRVHRLAGRLTGWSSAVDDLVQDVFVKVLTGAGKFECRSDPATWLTTITINVCRSHGRKLRTAARWLKQQLSRHNAAVEQVDVDETRKWVCDAMRKLRPPDRELIVLYHMEDWPAARIAQLIGVSVGAIDVRLHRARSRLRDILKADMGNR